MAYRVPTFNLLCSFGLPLLAGWPGSPAGLVFRVVDQPCNLARGRRVNFGASGGPGGSPSFMMNLLLPSLTDIRGLNSFTANGNRCDVVEVPQGSGRWYGTSWVDDVGKGFANEFRVANVVPIGSTWATPYP